MAKCRAFKIIDGEVATSCEAKRRRRTAATSSSPGPDQPLLGGRAGARDMRASEG